MQLLGLATACRCRPLQLGTGRNLAHGARSAWRPPVPHRHHSRRATVCAAAPGEPGPSNANDKAEEELAKTKQQLNRILESPGISGPELRQLVYEKWGKTFECRIQRRGKRVYLHVMWKHLEQQSFRMTEEEYDMQVQAVAEYLSMWGVADTVRAGIKAARKVPGYTSGGGARAVSIPLDVDLDGGRSGEWNTFLH